MSKPYDNGLYHLTDEEYFALPALGRSHLALLLAGQTYAHVKWHYDNDREKTGAMEVGSAAHMALFQPDLFAEKVIIHEATKTRASKAFQDTAALHKDKLVLTVDEHEEATCLARAAREKLDETGLCPLGGPTEVSAIYTYEDSLVLKCKVDYLDQDEKVIYDFKTSSKPVDADSFQRTIQQNGYHIQAAFYTWMMHRLGLPNYRFRFIATEKFPPFLTAIYEIDSRLTDDIASTFPAMLDNLAECVDTGVWPGYPDRPSMIGIPVWAAKKYYTVDEDIHTGTDD